MERYQKQHYSLTDIQFTRLAEQRTHDKQTQQAFEKFRLIERKGGRPRVFFCGFSEFTILDENAPEDLEHLRNMERIAIRYKC